MIIQTTSPLVRIEELNVTTVKPADEPFRQSAEAKIPPSKEQAQKLDLEGLGLRAIGRIHGVHYKTVSRWLVQLAGQLSVNQPKTQACSFTEVDELFSFVAKKIQMLDLGSDRFDCWQSAWLCLWW